MDEIVFIDTIPDRKASSPPLNPPRIPVYVPLEELPTSQAQGQWQQPSSTTLIAPSVMYDTNSTKYLGMNCIDVANHIQYCPVCSKLHKSSTPIYIGIILILIILAIYLGMRHSYR